VQQVDEVGRQLDLTDASLGLGDLDPDPGALWIVQPGVGDAQVAELAHPDAGAREHLDDRSAPRIRLAMGDAEAMQVEDHSRLREPELGRDVARAPSGCRERRDAVPGPVAARSAPAQPADGLTPGRALFHGTAEIPRRGVLVIDEAGMLPTRDLYELMCLTRERDTKLVGRWWERPLRAGVGADRYTACGGRVPARQGVRVPREPGESPAQPGRGSHRTQRSPPHLPVAPGSAHFAST
jgi:hypothetical protein